VRPVSLPLAGRAWATVRSVLVEVNTDLGIDLMLPVSWQMWFYRERKGVKKGGQIT